MLHHSDEIPGAVFLPKPFTPSDLLRAVSRVIPRPRPLLSRSRRSPERRLVEMSRLRRRDPGPLQHLVASFCIALSDSRAAHPLVEVESSVVLMQSRLRRRSCAGITVTRDLNCPCCRSSELAESLVPAAVGFLRGLRNGNRHAIVLPVSVRRVARHRVRLARFNWRRAGQASRGRRSTPRQGQEGKGEGKARPEAARRRQHPLHVPLRSRRQEPADRGAEYLTFKNIPWATVVPLLQNILEGKNDSLFNTFFVVNGEKKINRISVKTEANRIIAAFPKDGLEFYQQSYGATASGMLDDAIPPKGNYDLGAISEVSQKYFHTKAGAEATILLGTLYLERGNYLEAAYAFERFLTRPNIDDLVTPRTLFKACLALRRSGDARHAELLKTHLESLRKAAERNGLAFGRRTYTYEQLRAEIDRPLDLLRMSTTAGEWAMVGGTPTRAATIDGGPPFLDPIFRSPMFPANTEDDVEDANAQIRNELDHQYSRDSKRADLPIPAFFPITTPDMVVYRGYNGVYAVASRDQVLGGRVIRAGDLRWVSKTDFGLHQMMTKGGPDIDMYKSATEWLATYKQTRAGSIVHENPLLGGSPTTGKTSTSWTTSRSPRRRSSTTPTSAGSTRASSIARAATSPTPSAPAGSSRSISSPA